MPSRNPQLASRRRTQLPELSSGYQATRRSAAAMCSSREMAFDMPPVSQSRSQRPIQGGSRHRARLGLPPHKLPPLSSAHGERAHEQ